MYTMGDDVPTYRRNFSTTLALGGNRGHGSAGDFREEKPRVIAADEVFGDTDEPLLTPGAPTVTHPVDKGLFVKCVFFLLGIVVLIPSVFLMTASDYWMYKFRNATAGMGFDPAAKTVLQTNFFAAFGVFTNVPSLATIWVTTFINHRINQKLRNTISLCCVIVIFLLLTVFVKVDTDRWQYGFFILVMVILLIISVFATWLQGGVTGLASLLPQEYMNSCVVGMAVGGVFSSILQIMTIVWHPDPTNSGLFYFVCGTAVLLLGLFSFLSVQRTEFFKYHLKHPRAGLQNLITYEDLEMDVSILVVFRRVWAEALSVVATFCVTQSVFPAVTVLAVSRDVDSGSPWAGRLFTPICCYFLFNMGDLAGRIAGSFAPLGERREKVLLTLAVFRVVFVPLFMLCNARPRLHLPVVFGDDLSYIALVATFAVTNGYLFSVAMARAPRKVECYLQEKTGSMMTAFMFAGLAIGAVLSVVLVKIL